MIDYVLNATGVPKVHYIAFSQGTTAFWVMTSSKPEYNDKVVAMQALAPVGYFANAKSPLIKAIAPFTNSIDVSILVYLEYFILPFIKCCILSINNLYS